MVGGSQLVKKGGCAGAWPLRLGSAPLDTIRSATALHSRQIVVEHGELRIAAVTEILLSAQSQRDITGERTNEQRDRQSDGQSIEQRL